MNYHIEISISLLVVFDCIEEYAPGYCKLIVDIEVPECKITVGQRTLSREILCQGMFKFVQKKNPGEGFVNLKQRLLKTVDIYTMAR